MNISSGKGEPNSLRLAKDAWSLNWVIGYFIALAVIRVIAVSDMMSLTSAMAQGIPFLVAGALTALILFGWQRSKLEAPFIRSPINAHVCASVLR